MLFVKENVVICYKIECGVSFKHLDREKVSNFFSSGKAHLVMLFTHFISGLGGASKC